MRKALTVVILLALALCACSGTAQARDEIVVFSFAQVETSEADLNDTYSVKADDGYPASGGSAKEQSRFYATVTGVDYKKLEWSVY
ncbi:MAG: hypothetical protein Q4C12_03655, partial [Clostridia bacterium]|nr:hypothetical protein [Clostridia bacterium]